MKSADTPPAIQLIALIGNPNCGKTTLFNTLTGLRHKVGNYPGVTVEKKEGKLTVGDAEVSILDLPGTYSLSANSPDEQIVSDVLFGRISGTPIPDLVIFVADATNLERNLYLLSQIVDLTIPVIVALNMIDRVKNAGIEIDIDILRREFGVTFVPIVASKGTGVDALTAALAGASLNRSAIRQWAIPEPVKAELTELVSILVSNEKMSEPAAYHEAQVLLSTP